LLPRSQEVIEPKAVIKCVKCTRGLFRRFRRYSFGMPSKPQVSLNFKYCISFETSQGWNLSTIPSSSLS
jgi:hypothetical protein